VIVQMVRYHILSRLCIIYYGVVFGNYLFFYNNYVYLLKIQIKNISHILLLNDLIKNLKQINLKANKYYEV
jgi:hypothetical protein